MDIQAICVEKSMLVLNSNEEVVMKKWLYEIPVVCTNALEDEKT